LALFRVGPSAVELVLVLVAAFYVALFPVVVALCRAAALGDEALERDAVDRRRLTRTRLMPRRRQHVA
jgi:hypothetical protein